MEETLEHYCKYLEIELEVTKKALNQACLIACNQYVNSYGMAEILKERLLKEAKQ